MAPDFPSFNLPPVSPGNVANQKRGGRGGKMLRKRRRQRPDGSWEEVEEEVAEDDPDVELESDAFAAQNADGAALDDFMAAELPWAAEDAEQVRADAEREAEARALVESEERARLTAEAMLEEGAPSRDAATEPVSESDRAGRVRKGTGGLPPVPERRGSGPLVERPPAGSSERPGTGSLPPARARPGSGPLPAPPARGGTGSLAPQAPRGGTGSLPTPGANKASAGGPSPYLQGSWEYFVVDGATGQPVPAQVELSFTEARLVPVRRRQSADARGLIKGKGLPVGRYQLTVMAAGYHPISEVRFLRAEMPDKAVYRLQRA